MEGEDVRRQQRTAGLGQVPRELVEDDGLLRERKRGVSFVSVSKDGKLYSRMRTEKFHWRMSARLQVFAGGQYRQVQ